MKTIVFGATGTIGKLAVERALALVDGPKVEHRAEGSKLGDDGRNAGGSETTRND